MAINIEEAKNNLLATIDNIDRNKLSLLDLKTYAETLKIISEIQTKSFSDYISQISNGFGCGYKPTTISELKGGADNGV